MAEPLTALPDDDAPLSEWLRPLSATLDTRPNARWFSNLGSDRQSTAGRPRETPEAPAQPQTRKRWKKLTPEDEDRISALIKTGRKYAEIAIEAGVGQSTVERIASERGIGRGRGRQAKGAPCKKGCGNDVGAQNKSGTCLACQRGG